MRNKCLNIILILSALVSYRCEINKQEISTSKEIDQLSIYNELDSILKYNSINNDLDWMLIKSVIIKESHFDKNFISTAGAVGLMQLMPRKGSFTTTNYESFIKSRRQKRNSNGERIYKGKSDKEWANLYRKELDSLLNRYRHTPQELYIRELRFDPIENIKSGIEQLNNDYKYFMNRGHGKYKSKILALAAYNSGRGSIVRNKTDRKFDKIPINKQTELYIGYVERIYEELKKQDGKINKWNSWVLKI